MNENNVYIEDSGIAFIPRFVKQISDMEYGSVVSHENYNEKLNLNTTQGDYNTEVLRLLFMESDPTKVVHVKYLDNVINEQVTRLDERIDTFDDRITANTEGVAANAQAISDTNGVIESIINGPTVVFKAQSANIVTGADSAGTRKYYGTDWNNTVGFHDIPPALFAELLDGQTAEVQGIYVKPRLNSVTESMLTEAVRVKLNRANITDYDALENRPSINGNVLTGNKSLAELGIQEAGTYISPTGVDTKLIPYAEKTWVNTQLESYSTTAAIEETYATQVQLNSYATNSYAESLANNAKTNAIAVSNRVFINSPSATPRVGDLLVTV